MFTGGTWLAHRPDPAVLPPDFYPMPSSQQPYAGHAPQSFYPVKEAGLVKDPVFGKGLPFEKDGYPAKGPQFGKDPGLNNGFPLKEAGFPMKEAMAPGFPLKDPGFPLKDAGFPVKPEFGVFPNQFPQSQGEGYPSGPWSNWDKTATTLPQSAPLPFANGLHNTAFSTSAQANVTTTTFPASSYSYQRNSQSPYQARNSQSPYQSRNAHSPYSQNAHSPYSTRSSYSPRTQSPYASRNAQSPYSGNPQSPYSSHNSPSPYSHSGHSPGYSKSNLSDNDFQLMLGGAFLGTRLSSEIDTSASSGSLESDSKDGTKRLTHLSVHTMSSPQAKVVEPGRLSHPSLINFEPQARPPPVATPTGSIRSDGARTPQNFMSSPQKLSHVSSYSSPKAIVVMPTSPSHSAQDYPFINKPGTPQNAAMAQAPPSTLASFSQNYKNPDYSQTRPLTHDYKDTRPLSHNIDFKDDLADSFSMTQSRPLSHNGVMTQNGPVPPIGHAMSHGPLSQNGPMGQEVLSQNGPQGTDGPMGHAQNDPMSQKAMLPGQNGMEMGFVDRGSHFEGQGQEMCMSSYKEPFMYGTESCQSFEGSDMSFSPPKKKKCHKKKAPPKERKNPRHKDDSLIEITATIEDGRKTRGQKGTLTPEEVFEYLGQKAGVLMTFCCSYESCKERFEDIAVYVEHCLQLHNAYLCHECGKDFTTKSSLLRHRHIHTGLHRFACSICKKTFYRKDKCRAHIKRHLTEGSKASVEEVRVPAPRK